MHSLRSKRIYRRYIFLSQPLFVNGKYKILLWYSSTYNKHRCLMVLRTLCESTFTNRVEILWRAHWTIALVKKKRYTRIYANLDMIVISWLSTSLWSLCVHFWLSWLVTFPTFLFNWLNGMSSFLNNINILRDVNKRVHILTFICAFIIVLKQVARYLPSLPIHFDESPYR